MVIHNNGTRPLAVPPSVPPSHLGGTTGNMSTRRTRALAQTHLKILLRVTRGQEKICSGGNDQIAVLETCWNWTLDTVKARRRDVAMRDGQAKNHHSTNRLHSIAPLLICGRALDSSRETQNAKEVVHWLAKILISTYGNEMRDCPWSCRTHKLTAEFRAFASSRGKARYVYESYASKDE